MFLGLEGGTDSSEKSTAVPVGPPTDANGGGFAAGAGECGLVSMVEVAKSTELLPVGPQSGRADECGEGAFAAVVEETVAALVRSRLVFCSSLGKSLCGSPSLFLANCDLV